MSRRSTAALLLGVMLTFVTASFVLADDAAKPAGSTTTSDAMKSTTTATTPAKHMKHHAMAKPMVDLNSAAKEDLTKLPGITDEIADKIIAARPLKTKAELVSKGILTKAQYSKVRSKVVAKQAK